MSKTSVIIPACNERYLAQTIDDALAKAVEDVEVIAVLDGPTRYPPNVKGKNVRLVFHSTARGKRVSINHAASLATGEYLLVSDAHCMYGEGYDRILKHDCDGNWVMVPRRYSLDVEKWQPMQRTPVDYYYLTCPWNNPKRFSMQARPWAGRGKERLVGYDIDETMSFQGSIWFTSTEHFRKRIGNLDIAWWGTSHSGDWLEIGMKTWMAGGKVMVDKRTWYAHWCKSAQPRGYKLNILQVRAQLIEAAQYWTADKWEGNVNGRSFGWLVDHFWPLPLKGAKASKDTYYWPEDWREYYEGRITSKEIG